MHRVLEFFQISFTIFFIILYFYTCDGISIKHRHLTYKKRHSDLRHFTPSSPIPPSNFSTSEISIPTTVLPEIFSLTEQDPLTTELLVVTTVSPSILEPTQFPIAEESTTTAGPSQIGAKTNPSRINFDELTSIIRHKRQECRKLGTPTLRRSNEPSTLTCEKLKLSSWFMDQLEKNSTDLLNSYVQLVKNVNGSDSGDETQLLPESRPERFVYRLISVFGEPVDKLLFYQFKKYTKSRHVQIKVPHVVTLQFEPRTHAEVSTGRTFFDPGFNLKLKFPFFHDELKVAVSTGPSFLVGVGVGLVVLGIKSIFAPFIFAIKAMILSWFFKDMSPMDMVKTLASPMLPSWMTGWRPEPEAHYSGWQQAVEHYDQPNTHNTHDSYSGSSHQENVKPSGLMGALTHLLPFTSQDQNQFPMFQNHRPSGHAQSGGRFRQNYHDEGRTQVTSGGYRPSHYDGSQVMRPNTIEGHGGSGPEDEDEEHGGEDTGYKYVPQMSSGQGGDNLDNLDPFYSPLLSRIDSIFMHLGFTEEGCKERAVCSIYKYPVKYAPYSNLLSAQLSKHQSELKRPVNTSPKVLRYFKYMKAAKDGQAALNCIELYPLCSNDTEKLTNLPMVKTFQQLTELMGTTGTGPTG